MAPRVEIFVLSYNRAAYLGECVQSILAQTFADFAVTVLDNASTDDVARVVNNFDDRRLRLIRNATNIGPAANWIKALDMASAEFVMLFHDDDALSPRLIERQMQLFRSYPELTFVATGVTLVNDDARMAVFEDAGGFAYELFRSPDELLRAYFAGGSFGFASILYRRAVAQSVRPDVGRFANVGDRAYMLRLATVGPCARLIRPTYNVRVHPQQDSATQSWSYVHELELLRYYMEVGGRRQSLRVALSSALAHGYAVQRERAPFREWFGAVRDRGLLHPTLAFHLPYYLARVAAGRWARAHVPVLRRAAERAHAAEQGR